MSQVNVVQQPTIVTITPLAANNVNVQVADLSGGISTTQARAQSIAFSIIGIP